MNQPPSPADRSSLTKTLLRRVMSMTSFKLGALCMLFTLGAVATQPAAAQGVVLSPTATSLSTTTGGSVVFTLVSPVLWDVVGANLCQDFQGAPGVVQVATGAVCEGRLAVPVTGISGTFNTQFTVAIPGPALLQAASTGPAQPRSVHLQLLLQAVALAPPVVRRVAMRITLIEPAVNLANGPRATQAQLRFVGALGQQPVGFFALDQVLPPVEALLRFQGSGLLRARWEVVQPGDPQPSALDLTPATQLSLAERGQQRHWRAVGGVQQQWVSSMSLVRWQGPPPRLLPSDQLGAYTLLLRLEPYQPLAPAQSPGLTPAAGQSFVMPVLRYFVGTTAGAVLAHETPGPIRVLAPQGIVFGDRPLVFTWQQRPDIALYRVELQRAGELVYAARVLPQGQGSADGALIRQTLPSWLQQQLRAEAVASRAAAQPLTTNPTIPPTPQAPAGQGLRWRVVSVGAEGEAVSTSHWVTIHWVD